MRILTVSNELSVFGRFLVVLSLVVVVPVSSRDQKHKRRTTLAATTALPPHPALLNACLPQQAKPAAGANPTSAAKTKNALV